MNIRYIENIDDLYNITREFGGSYGNKPLKRIFSLLEREREYIDKGCISIIITEDYQDQEWDQEYEKYYKNMFIADRERITDTTTKLDFFIGRINNISEIQDLDNSRFLGYIILRPLPTQKVCESIIKIPTKMHGLNHFIKCKEIFLSKIGNREFKIEGFPFVQQDIITGVCAHACLRMISLYLSRKYETLNLSIPEINIISEEVVIEADRMSNISAEGLWTTHIYRIFKEMGCKSLIYDFTYKENEERPKPNELIYSYMESGFPVFVGFQTETTGHSVVVVGHTFDPNSWWPEAEKDYYRKLFSHRPPCLKSFTWTDFIIQDDNFGPYLIMPRDFPPITAIAIPIPQNIPLVILVEDAEAIAYGYISNNRIIEAASKLIIETEERERKWIEMYHHHVVEGKLVLRTFLLEKKEFIENLTKRDDLSKDLKFFYSLLDLPDRFWITEISVPELFSHKRHCLGEVIIDPTCPIGVFGANAAIISIHLPGIIFWNDPETKELQYIKVKNDTPYQHHMKA